MLPFFWEFIKRTAEYRQSAMDVWNAESHHNVSEEASAKKEARSHWDHLSWKSASWWLWRYHKRCLTAVRPWSAWCLWLVLAKRTGIIFEKNGGEIFSIFSPNMRFTLIFPHYRITPLLWWMQRIDFILSVWIRYRDGTSSRKKNYVCQQVLRNRLAH